MWSYSSPDKEHTKTADWMRGILSHNKSKYTLAAIVGVSIVLAISFFVMYSNATPVSNVVTNQDIYEPTKPAPVKPADPDPEPKPIKQVDNKSTTNVNATINNSSKPVSTPVKTNIRVNNQKVAVPDNGSVDKTIESKDGNTSIDISLDSNSNGSTQTNSYTNIQLNTTTRSEMSVENSE